MKVLFAINNDNDFNAIIKKYQQDYREILSYKNVYYFDAILKELQKDKIYDRVVISEDLEPFANNNYEIIDKFLADKLGKIIGEAKKINGDKIDIILICTDRRNRSDEIISKYFKMGINNALVKQDRNIEQVCKLINSPRNETEGRQYYKIAQSTSANQADENYVSEAEVQNIIMHYKRLGKNEDKYVESFNNIIAQYTDEQLKIIINYLPIQVRAVLEERSQKYQELITFSRNNNKKNYNKYNSQKEEKIGIKMLEDSSSKEKINRPIVIPSNINTVVKKSEPVKEDNKLKEVEIPDLDIPEIEEVSKEEVVQEIEVPQKRGRGRPKKNVEPQVMVEEKPKRGRGRPKKIVEEIKQEDEKQENVQNDEDDDLLDLFNLDTVEDTDSKTEIKEDKEIDLFSLNDDEKDEDVDLFNLKNEETEENDFDLFSLDDEEQEEDEEQEKEESINLFDIEDEKKEETKNDINLQTSQSNYAHNISTLLTSDKKVISFVGTTKNGTSFIVNNIAALLSSMGISTAILDMTVSKNAYYIYTNNEENLRNIAKDSIKKLENGIANGIKINKNLSVYTSLPGENEQYINIENIIATLVQNHSAVLIDTDFNTPKEIFGISQEIYLVQSMDVLTIQPLTSFLRDLKSKGVLKPEKLKIVINKALKVRNLSEKVLIGGMAYYNDPAMSFMTELFNKDNILYCTIPFEVQNYSKYLEALANCQIDLNSYTKSFMYALNELGNMVYPLINKQTYKPMGNKRDHFSSEVNNTLGKMRNKY